MSKEQPKASEAETSVKAHAAEAKKHRDQLAQDPDVLFVSCNPKAGPVTRYGTQTYIGATRPNLLNEKGEPLPGSGKVIKYDTDAVIMIPGDEARRYLREYSKALRTGDLVKRTRDDFEKREAAELEQEIQRIQKHASDQAAELAKSKAAEAEKNKPQGGAPSSTTTT